MHDDPIARGSSSDLISRIAYKIRSGFGITLIKLYGRIRQIAFQGKTWDEIHIELGVISTSTFYIDGNITITGITTCSIGWVYRLIIIIRIERSDIRATFCLCRHKTQTGITSSGGYRDNDFPTKAPTANFINN